MAERPNPPVQILLDEIEAFQEAHDLATSSRTPQVVKIDGKETTVEDKGPTRVVTQKR
jgi:hypothetical protein